MDLTNHDGKKAIGLFCVSAIAKGMGFTTGTKV